MDIQERNIKIEVCRKFQCKHTAKAVCAAKVCVLFISFVLISCSDKNTVQIWTDRPEFALYGEFFNNAQKQYKVSVKYMEFPINGLNRANSPDIIIASWLKNSSTQTYFKNISNIFGTKKLSRNIFYPRLLAAGRIDGRNQYLLPVSFNVPALIFSKEQESEISNQFTINFDEIKRISSEYNTEVNGSYTRMGFSPLWNSDFLFDIAMLRGASFREDEPAQGARTSARNPLVWDSPALERSMSFIHDWTNEINTSSRMDEDFSFKYFSESKERLIQSGRILFSYIKSNQLFLIDDEVMPALDFRWIMEQGMIPIAEDMIMLGIPKWSNSQNAARAFIMWFFSAESQRQLLDYFRSNRLNENIFGICGGFSAISSVTEYVYPVFYPELLGRMPPSEYFMEPNILPARWAAIKDRVILPYMSERAGVENSGAIVPLERRITDWVRLNR